jgi:hypothetical protein
MKPPTLQLFPTLLTQSKQANSDPHFITIGYMANAKTG